MPPALPPSTTRRTALGAAAVGVLLVSGCDLDNPRETPAAPSSTAPPEDPDAALLDAVVAEVDELLATVSLAVERRPSAAAELALLTVLHRAHRDALPERAPTPTAPRLPRRGPEVLTALLARERRAQARLADWAVDARSGSLARLLASMSAGVATHLAALDPAVRT